MILPDQNANLGQSSKNTDAGNATTTEEQVSSKAETKSNLVLPVGITKAYINTLGVTSLNAIAAECDIGKLLDSGIDLQKLSRDENYCILTTNPSLDTSSYPRTRPYASGSFASSNQWLKQHPWLHLADMQIVPFAEGVHFLDRISIAWPVCDQTIQHLGQENSGNEFSLWV